jgi:hypothetical protein
MMQFVCLVFGARRKGVAVQTIDADSEHDANLAARRLMDTHADAQGYEVWRGGEKAGSYFKPPASLGG